MQQGVGFETGSKQREMGSWYAASCPPIPTKLSAGGRWLLRQENQVRFGLRRAPSLFESDPWLITGWSLIYYY